MNSSRKSIIGLMIATVITLSACGDDLFDAAKRAADGYNVAYAVVDDGVERRMLITDGGSFRQEMTINGMPFNATSPSEICVDDNGRIFASYWDSVFINNGSSGWTQTSPTGYDTVLDIVSRNGEVLALVASSNKSIYRYESDSGTPWTLDKTGMAELVGMARPSDDDRIYLYSSSGNIYNYSDFTVAGTFSAGGTPLFLDRINGVFFVGFNNGFVLSPPGGAAASAGLTNAQAYTVMDSSLVYAMGTAGGMSIVTIVKININDGSGSPLPVDFGSGSIGFLNHLDRTTLVIGINASATAGKNGLWIYKTDLGALTQISPVPVYGLHVRR